MHSNAEQIKQKIAIEIENARFISVFLLPIIITLITLAFTKQFFPEKPSLRIIFGIGLFLLLTLLFLYRIEAIKNARKLIEKL